MDDSQKQELNSKALNFQAFHVASDGQSLCGEQEKLLTRRRTLLREKITLPLKTIRKLSESTARRGEARRFGSIAQGRSPQTAKLIS